MDISNKGLRQIRTVDTRSPSGRSRNKTTSSGFSNRTTGMRTSCSSITIGTGRKEGSFSRFGHRISRMRNSCSSNSAGTSLKTATSSRFTDRTSLQPRARCLLTVFHERILPFQSRQKHFRFDIYLLLHLTKDSPLSTRKETTK